MSDEFAAFKARFERDGKDPEAVVKLLVEGMTALERDAELGAQLMALVCSKKGLQEAPGTLSGYAFRRADSSVKRLLADRNIARSYAGGSHQRGYEDFDAQNLAIALDKAYSAGAQGVDYPQAGQAKLFVASGGADNPRPVTLARNNAGYWKVTSFSSLTTGVRRPAAEEGDF